MSHQTSLLAKGITFQFLTFKHESLQMAAIKLRKKSVEIRKQRYKTDLKTMLQNDLGCSYWHMALSK